MSNGAYISSVDYYLPENIELNEDLMKEFPDKVDEKLIESLGVRARRVASKNTRASHIGRLAAEQLLSNTGFDKNNVDALVYCSLNHDYITPATSCLLQHEIGLKTSIATFDLNHGCSGYIYSLALTKSIIQSLHFKHVLLVTSTIPTKYVHPKNIAIRLLFGDASSATMVSAGDGGGSIGEFVFGTDGKGYQKIIIRDGWDANPLSDTSLLEKTDQFGNIYTDSSIDMDGPSTFYFIIKKVPALIEEILKKNDLHKDDIDLYILHQANYFALEHVRNRLQIEQDRFFYSMKETGNTIQSTIPICLKEAMDAGKIKSGTKVLIAGFGTGQSWGGTVITF